MNLTKDMPPDLGNASPAKKSAQVASKLQDLLPAFEQELSKQDGHKGCLSAFRFLNGQGQCAADELRWYITTLRLAFEHHARIQDEPYRMDSNRLRTLVRKPSGWLKNGSCNTKPCSARKFCDGLNVSIFPRGRGEFQKIAAKIAVACK